MCSSAIGFLVHRGIRISASATSHKEKARTRDDPGRPVRAINYWNERRKERLSFCDGLLSLFHELRTDLFGPFVVNFLCRLLEGRLFSIGETDDIHSHALHLFDQGVIGRDEALSRCVNVLLGSLDGGFANGFLVLGFPALPDRPC